MKIDKIRIYIFQFVLLVSLVSALFVLNAKTRIFLSFFLTIFAIFTYIFIKRKKSGSIHKKQVIYLMALFGIIYLLSFYLMGLYFGYYKAPIKFGIVNIFKYIVPTSVIIFSSEIIRHLNLSQEAKGAKVLTYISMVIIDLIVYIGAYDIKDYDDFLAIIGFILFASISCNLLYNYVTVRYGYIGIVVYRLMTILYMYFIPIIPNIYIFFRSFLRMIYPYMIYLFLESTYDKNGFIRAYKDKRKGILINCSLLLSMLLIIMLISCKFKYGMIVIGSGSMAQTLRKGDAIIYESYDGQKINKGEIIVFDKDDIQVIHRVIEIREVNGEYHYYTKGDANLESDLGYITRANIVGVSKVRVPYLGYPSIWIRDLFKN